MEVLIVGAGTMGRWFADATGDATVAFADVDAAAAEDAAAAADARVVPLDTDERFDVVCVAVPMTITPTALADHAGKATRAVCDLSGVMGPPVAAMAEHAPDLERASFHPLFAPANAPGRIAVVADRPGPTIDAIRSALAAADNTLFETTPEEHDAAMATVQGRAHAAVLAFGLAAEAVPEPFGTPVYDGLRSLVEEVTGGTPRVYADIQETFDGAADVATAARALAEADRETFERLYRDAGG